MIYCKNGDGPEVTFLHIKLILSSFFFAANGAKHLLSEAYFRLSSKPSSQLVSNLIRRHHHGSNSEVIYEFGQWRITLCALTFPASSVYWTLSSRAPGSITHT